MKYLVTLIGITFFSVLNAQNASKGIIKEGKGIENVVSLGEKRSEIKNRLGTTEKCATFGGKITKINDNIVKDTRKHKVKKSRYFYCYSKLGIEILFNSKKKPYNNGKWVGQINIKSSNYTTLKGISVGDDREKVKSLYGGECNAKRNVYYSLGIAFIIDETSNTVSEIEIFYPQK